MKNLFKLSMALFIGAAMFSCQQAEEPTMDQGQAPETRAFGDTPVVAIYVETNDTNPLNAGDYTMSNGKPFAGIVELFASNVRKRTVNGVVEPTLYLNDKMTNLLENNGYLTYVKPLQDKGIKVLLTVLGDHQGIGVASMNSTQTTQFAQILAHAVAKYGLDGIGFDDEYADDWGCTNSTSYSEIILKLHALMPADKLITVFDWGYTGSINAEAKACIDYSYHGYFGTSFVWFWSFGQSPLVACIDQSRCVYRSVYPQFACNTCEESGLRCVYVLQPAPQFSGQSAEYVQRYGQRSVQRSDCHQRQRQPCAGLDLRSGRL
ncbi:MAG: glycosyl hydrolase family 18 protein [Alistipes finegoldii]